MLLALVACWRPDPYLPPEPPPLDDVVLEEGVSAAAEPVEPPTGPADQADLAEADVPAAEDEDQRSPFSTYNARTVQAPVTLVDDYGKLLVVLPSAGWELEVRDEDTIRARVWCAGCAPPVEGWIQAHLIQRAQ